MNEIVFLSGLPRSGSTLLANVLAMHPTIASTPSSPLCNMVNNMRVNWSDDVFLLAQLDEKNLDDILFKLKYSTQAFMSSWSLSEKYMAHKQQFVSEPSQKFVTVDKNRGWLACCEWLREIYPNFKMIITLRDLVDIYKSIEKRHRKTLLLDFPDHLEHNNVSGRATQLFNDGGIIGAPLRSLKNLGFIPNIVNHLYFWKYEDFLIDPQRVSNHLFEFLGLPNHEIDFSNIVQSTFEADSFYRMKFPHKIHPKVEKSTEQVDISPIIMNDINTQFDWFKQDYYPETINQGVPPTPENVQDSNLSQSLEDLIEQEV